MFEYVYIDDLRVARPSLHGLGSPNPRRDVTLKAARHGATDRTAYYEGRVLDLGGIIVGSTELEAWTAFDVLKGKLQLGAPRLLKFRRKGFSDDEQLEVFAAGPVDEAVTFESPRVIRWGASLHAPDPRIYGAVLRSGSYDPAAATSGGGVDVPLTFPLTFPTTTATRLDLTNAGNTATPPVLTIRGPVVNPVLDNDTVRDSIFITYSLGASDTVEVDVAARSVKLNGTERLDLLNAADTTWWELQAGTNHLRLRGSGMALGQTLLTCQYRDARI